WIVVVVAGLLASLLAAVTDLVARRERARVRGLFVTSIVATAIYAMFLNPENPISGGLALGGAAIAALGAGVAAGLVSMVGGLIGGRRKSEARAVQRSAMKKV